MNRQFRLASLLLGSALLTAASTGASAPIPAPPLPQPLYDSLLSRYGTGLADNHATILDSYQQTPSLNAMHAMEGYDRENVEVVRKSELYLVFSAARDSDLGDLSADHPARLFADLISPADREALKSANITQLADGKGDSELRERLAPLLVNVHRQPQYSKTHKLAVGESPWHIIQKCYEYVQESDKTKLSGGANDIDPGKVFDALWSMNRETLKRAGRPPSRARQSRDYAGTTLYFPTSLRYARPRNARDGSSKWISVSARYVC